MHRFVARLVVVLVFAAVIAGRGWAPALAQESTPAAGPIAAMELAPGVTAEIFAGAPSARAEGQTVYLARFVFQPGAEIFPHSHPGTTVLGVQSGSFGWTLLKGEAYVVRGAAAGGTETEELDEPGDDVVLEPGDAIYYEDDVVHTARGAGDEPAVVLGTFVLTTGEPLLMPANMDMSGTPAASAAGGAVEVSLTEFAIAMPAEIPAGPTTFTITNNGTVEHNFEVEGQGIEEELDANLAPGETGTLKLDLQPGTYEVYCPVDEHADHGMKLELTVTG